MIWPYEQIRKKLLQITNCNKIQKVSAFPAIVLSNLNEELISSCSPIPKIKLFLGTVLLVRMREQNTGLNMHL